jgi:antibiotic biosynthesis monooxygenase (ABM) superfamily enzyme
MIVYAVELEMETALRAEYLAWLRTHVADMLALPGFLGAEILARSEPAPPAGRRVVCVHYRLRDRAAWQGYLEHHATHMRAAGIERFGDRVHASRRLFEPV